MQIRVAMGMLATLVLVLLAPSMTEGLVLTRCEMQQKLQNQTLPANISSNLSGNTTTNASSDAAHIVCYAELVSGLNTSKVSQPIKPLDNSHEDDDSSENSGEVKPHKGRRQRSLRSRPGPKQDKKSEKGDKDGKGGKPPKPDTQSVTKQPISSEPHPHNTTGGNQTGSHDLHPQGDHSSESSEEVKPHKGRKQRSVGSKPGPKQDKKSEKGDKGGKPPKPDTQSVTKQPFPRSEPHTESHPHNTTGGNHTGSHDLHPQGDHSSESSEDVKPNKGRKQRSLLSISEKKSDKGDKGDKGGKPPKPNTQSVTKQPISSEPHPHNTTGGNHTGSHDLHPQGDHSSESSEEVKPNKGRKQRSLLSISEKKSDKGDKGGNGGKPPKPGTQSVTKQPFPHSEPPKGTGVPNQNSSMAPNPVRPTGHHDDDDSAEFKSKGRHRRSPKWPKPGPKPQPKPDPKPQPKPQPKPEPKPEKGGEQLYGVFQLSDRVACASGSKPTLNLCGLTCDKLVDDDITDDIACLRTLLSKFTPGDSLKGEAREYVKKLYDQIYQKQCAGATDAQFFSGC